MYLGRAEVEQLRPHLRLAGAALSDPALGTWASRVSVAAEALAEVGLWNLLDATVVSLVVVCSVMALVSTPGPWLVSLLSVAVLLSVTNV